MKKNVKVRIICLVTAAVMLSGAVTAAAIMGSPYETLKNAALDTLSAENVTVESTTTIFVNGELVRLDKTYYSQGDESYLNYYYDEDGVINGFNFRAAGFSTGEDWSTRYDTDIETKWYYANVWPVDIKSYNYRSYSYNAFFGTVNRSTAYARLVELLIDLVVGDLKNNVTMTSENGNRSIRAAFTGSQMPEIVNVGIEFLIEQSHWGYGETRPLYLDGDLYYFENEYRNKDTKNITVYKQTVRPMTDFELEVHNAWNESTLEIDDPATWDWLYSWIYNVSYIHDTPYITDGGWEFVSERTEPVTRADYANVTDPMQIPIDSIIINSVRGEAEVDAGGNLLNVDLTGTATVINMFGDRNEVELKYNTRFTDIGTSDPICPIPGAEQFFTSENMLALVGSEHANVYFTLNPDGTINTDSISTMHPYEQARWVGYDRYPIASQMPMPVPVPPTASDVKVKINGVEVSG